MNLHIGANKGTAVSTAASGKACAGATRASSERAALGPSEPVGKVPTPAQQTLTPGTRTLATCPAGFKTAHWSKTTSFPSPLLHFDLVHVCEGDSHHVVRTLSGVPVTSLSLRDTQVTTAPHVPRGLAVRP